MSEPEIFFVTGNEHKASIFKDIMKPEYLIERIEPETEIEELKSKSVREVVQDKLKKAGKMVERNGLIFVTDVGFYISGLGGDPGALIKRRTREKFSGNFGRWCSELSSNDSRKATVRNIIGAYSEKGEPFYVEHNLEGRVPKNPEDGEYGFDWDKIFIPNWEDYGKDLNGKSLAQVEPQKKFDVLARPLIENFKEKLNRRKNTDVK